MTSLSARSIVDDPDVNVSGCIWPAFRLAVGDTATCIVGPVTAVARARTPIRQTATGTYLATTVTDTSTATYSTNPLTLGEGGGRSPGSLPRESLLNYTYGVTNTGNVTLTGPITVTDDKATVTCPPGDIWRSARRSSALRPTSPPRADVSAGQVTNIATAHRFERAAGVVEHGDQDGAAPRVRSTSRSARPTACCGSRPARRRSTPSWCTNNGPSADGATLADPAVTGLTKALHRLLHRRSAGPSARSSGGGAGELNITNLEAGTVVIPTLPNGGSLSITVTVLVTSRAGTAGSGDQRGHGHEGRPAG